MKLKFEPDRVLYDERERLIRIFALDEQRFVCCAVSKAALVVLEDDALAGPHAMATTYRRNQSLVQEIANRKYLARHFERGNTIVVRRADVIAQLAAQNGAGDTSKADRAENGQSAGLPGMTAERLQSKAWQVIQAARITRNPGRRRLLMREAFDLARRASVLRHGAIEQRNGTVPFTEGYQLRLRNGEGGSLWIDQNVEHRAEAIWAAYALATACTEQYQAYELWDGPDRLLAEREIASIWPDTAEEVSAATQQTVVECEELLLRSHATLAFSRVLLRKTQSLGSRLAHR